MKIVVTGSKGLVGTALVRVLNALGDEVLALSRHELDIRDTESAEKILLDFRPDVLVNCAAYTDVDGAELEQVECYEANATAVGGLARASARAGAGFITISTDYVFDGKKEGFYYEKDKPNPLSVYGRSKLAGEEEARKGNANSKVVRTGWIFGKGGSNFLSVIPELLRKSSPVRTISDAYGTPTYAEDLALRLRELAGHGQPGVYHVTNAGEGSSYALFARKIAALGGYGSGQIEAVKSSDLERRAARPLNSRLGCAAVRELGLPELPHWHDAIERYLKE